MNNTSPQLVLNILLALVALIILTTIGSCSAQPRDEAGTDIQALVGLEIEYVLTPETIRAFPSPIGPDFEITSVGTAILRAGDMLLELERDENQIKVDRLNQKSIGPDSFALADSTLLTISGHYFGQLDQEGQITEAMPLPYHGMRLARSIVQGSVYLYGGDHAKGYRVYLVRHTGDFLILAELPEEIVAVCDSTTSLYVATRKTIYKLTADSIKVVLRFPEDSSLDSIISIAVEHDNSLLYISMGSKLFALKGLSALSILGNTSGQLRLHANKLFALDQKRNLLISIKGLKSVLLKNPQI